MTTFTKVRWMDRLNGHVHEEVACEDSDLEALTDDPDVIVLAFEDTDATTPDLTKEGGPPDDC